MEQYWDLIVLGPLLLWGKKQKKNELKAWKSSMMILGLVGRA